MEELVGIQTAFTDFIDPASPDSVRWSLNGRAIYTLGCIRDSAQ